MTTKEAEQAYLMDHILKYNGRPIVVHNPHNLEISSLPRIYAFSGHVRGGEGICYAVAEDGECLGSHWCSHEFYAPADLGVIEGTRDDRHEDYRGHYPDGYIMEFVASKEVDSHEILQEALALNKAKRPAEE